MSQAPAARGPNGQLRGTPASRLRPGPQVAQPPAHCGRQRPRGGGGPGARRPAGTRRPGGGGLARRPAGTPRPPRAAPQVWQCGGSMEVLPCSRVAHIERSRKPYNNDIDYYAKRNALRAAEVWMDGFKSHVYMAWNIPMTVSGRRGRRGPRAAPWGRPPAWAPCSESPCEQP